jgi:hypothetical protein
MTKHSQKNRTFIPGYIPEYPYILVPEAERNDGKFQKNIDEWFAQWLAYHPHYGPAFVDWVKEIINRTKEPLARLFHRYGIQPSIVLHRLALKKHFLLTREELERGVWITDVPDWYLPQVRIGLPDSREAKMLRNKKLKERKALILEKAAGVLLDYPRYLGVVADMPDPFRLPERLRLIAKDIRSQTSNGSQRPQAHAARYVVEDLIKLFKDTTGSPLYEYAGRITKICFPEEWNPAGDIREAAKKLFVYGKRIEANARRQQELDLEARGLPKLSKLSSLIRDKKVGTVADLEEKVPELAELVASLRRLDQQMKNTVHPANTIGEVQTMITEIGEKEKSLAAIWANLSSFMKATIAGCGL